MLQARQFPKNSRSVFGIVVRHNFTCRFVIRNHTRWWWVNANAKWTSIDFDLIAVLNALTNVSGLIVDRNSALQNELLHFKA